MYTIIPRKRAYASAIDPLPNYLRTQLNHAVPPWCIADKVRVISYHVVTTLSGGVPLRVPSLALFIPSVQTIASLSGPLT